MSSLLLLAAPSTECVQKMDNLIPLINPETIPNEHFPDKIMLKEEQEMLCMLFGFFCSY
jgi:hypothetical protein